MARRIEDAKRLMGTSRVDCAESEMEFTPDCPDYGDRRRRKAALYKVEGKRARFIVPLREEAGEKFERGGGRLRGKKRGLVGRGEKACQGEAGRRGEIFRKGGGRRESA